VQTFVRINQLVSTPKRQGRLPIHRNTLWRWVASGEFPTPIKLGPNITAWRLSDIESWEKARGVLPDSQVKAEVDGVRAQHTASAPKHGQA
jgi:predicted DNA-binding transcriptional regulator AlpA